MSERRSIVLAADIIAVIPKGTKMQINGRWINAPTDAYLVMTDSVDVDRTDSAETARE